MMTKPRTIALLIAILGGFMAQAQTTYEFDVTSGTWDDPNDWDPPSGPPGAGDTAIIGNGETCTVPPLTAAQFVKILEVQAGGTLIIDANTLTVGQIAADTTSTLDGTIQLKRSVTTVGTLTARGRVIFQSSGVGGGLITASKALSSAHEGRLASADNLAQVNVFDFRSGIDLKGSIGIRSSIAFSGRLIVEHASDVMWLGPSVPVDFDNRPFIGGSEPEGDLSVSAGAVRAGHAFVGLTAWNMSAGEIEILPAGSGLYRILSSQVNITGGTFIANDDFGSYLTTGTVQNCTIECGLSKYFEVTVYPLDPD